MYCSTPYGTISRIEKKKWKKGTDQNKESLNNKRTSLKAHTIYIPLEKGSSVRNKFRYKLR